MYHWYLTSFVVGTLFLSLSLTALCVFAALYWFKVRLCVCLCVSVCVCVCLCVPVCACACTRCVQLPQLSPHCGLLVHNSLCRQDSLLHFSWMAEQEEASGAFEQQQQSSEPNEQQGCFTAFVRFCLDLCQEKRESVCE